MLTTSGLGWETDMPMGRLAVHLPSSSEGIAACAIELEMSSKCEKGILLYCSPHILRFKGGTVCVCIVHKNTLVLKWLSLCMQELMHTLTCVGACTCEMW